MSVKNAISFVSFFGAMMLYLTSISAQALDPANFMYYFFVNGQMYDVRDFASVQTQLQPGQLVKHNGLDTFSIHNADNNELAFYNTKAEKFTKVKFYESVEALSTDHRSLLSIKDNDFWIKDISPLSGASELRRLTNTGGIFKTKLDRYWYKDKLMFTILGDPNFYLVNTKSAELSVYDNPFPIANQRTTNKSPDSRYLIGKDVDPKIEDTFYWDMETDEKFDLFPAEYSFMTTWFDNERVLFVFQRLDPNHRGLINYSFMDYNISSDESKVRIETNIPGGIDGHLLALENGKARCISPDNSYICFLFQKHPDYNNAVYIFDLETQEKKLVLSGEEAFARGRYNTPFKWINDNQFIYAIDGSSLLNRGTFIYSVKEDKKQKVSPLVATALWAFEGNEYAMFFANGKLFRVKSDGSGLMEFPHPLAYSNNISLLLK